MNAMPVAITRCSADLRYLWVSERYAEWLDVPVAEITGNRIADVIGEAGMSAIRPYIDVVLSGQGVEYEDRITFRKIGERWIHAEYQPTHGPTGAVDGWVACVIDVTDRKRAEERLSVAHAALARLFELSVMPGGTEAMPELLQMVLDTAIEVTDADMGNLQLYDDATASLRIVAERGFSPPFLEHFGTVRGGHGACGEAVRSRQQTIVENVAESPLFDGASQRVLEAAEVRSVQSTPLTSRDGRILGVISTHWRKRQRPDPEQLRTLEIVARQAADSLAHLRQEERLLDADRRKDEFLAMLGHELRNPLAPIVTATELMKLRGADLLEKERKVIERQAQHLTRLVDDLLDVSRITRGKIELRKESVALAQIVAKAVEIASPALELRRHRLAVDVSPELVIDADPARMVQVVANLLTNAAAYTDPGGEICVRGGETPDTITLLVLDSGIGIAPAMLPFVFDPFVQEKQGLDRPRGGLGLGLSIVKGLVELHSGSVSAQSEGLGRGSTFSVSLPRSPQQPPAPVAAPELDERRSNGTRVLIVDDNEEAAETLADALTELGHEVRIAHDGPSALKIVEEFTPGVALIDIGLPVMDGYELARRLLERPALSHLRLIAVSGYGEPSAARRSGRAGFEAHLVKPVPLGAVERAIRTARFRPRDS
jgi:PAS domain S-box-containing protein